MGGKDRGFTPNDFWGNSYRIKRESNLYVSKAYNHEFWKKAIKEGWLWIGKWRGRRKRDVGSKTLLRPGFCNQNCKGRPSVTPGQGFINFSEVLRGCRASSCMIRAFIHKADTAVLTLFHNKRSSKCAFLIQNHRGQIWNFKMQPFFSVIEA